MASPLLTFYSDLPHNFITKCGQASSVRTKIEFVYNFLTKLCYCSKIGAKHLPKIPPLLLFCPPFVSPLTPHDCSLLRNTEKRGANRLKTDATHDRLVGLLCFCDDSVRNVMFFLSCMLYYQGSVIDVQPPIKAVDQDTQINADILYSFESNSLECELQIGIFL